MKEYCVVVIFGGLNTRVSRVFGPFDKKGAGEFRRGLIKEAYYSNIIVRRNLIESAEVGDARMKGLEIRVKIASAI